uniref:Calreticulin n=1 Tax=Prolemur simus TaxID=1328070 RepID=A0A8C8ZGM8_PROSS
ALLSVPPLLGLLEQFLDGDGWTHRWTGSKHKSDFGKFVLSSGKFYGDQEKDKGKRSPLFALSARFEPFSNKGQTLVVQFTVKHEQNIDCGGGYVKLFPDGLDQTDMHGDLEYIMFGPDICGPGAKKVHGIFNYKGMNVLINKDIRCKDDEFTHLYTLIVRSDNTYEVKIDNSQVESGFLEDNWDFLPPKKIKHPDADWDKPEHIPDPDAKKPEDWDEEMDGEWEPPVIQNPKYNGKWKPQQINNPDYKGTWIHPEIDNPEYSPDPNIYAYDSFAVLGLDLWQVKSGTIFDNFLITNDEAYAEDFGNETWGVTKAAEKQMKDKQDEEQRLKEEEEVDKKRKEEEEAEDKEDEEDKDEDEEDEEDKEDDEEEDTPGQAKDEL